VAVSGVDAGPPDRRGHHHECIPGADPAREDRTAPDLPAYFHHLLSACTDLPSAREQSGAGKGTVERTGCFCCATSNDPGGAGTRPEAGGAPGHQDERACAARYRGPVSNLSCGAAIRHGTLATKRPIKRNYGRRPASRVAARYGSAAQSAEAFSGWPALERRRPFLAAYQRHAQRDGGRAGARGGRCDTQNLRPQHRPVRCGGAGAAATHAGTELGLWDSAGNSG
jgi:hypothetical protein